SLAAYQKGHALGSRTYGWRYPSADWIKAAERLVELDRKLPAVLRGAAQPAGNAERLALSDLCRRYKRLPAASARLCAEAFAAEPALSQWHQNGYNATCSAALAACGQGEDAGHLPDKEQAHWRRQALLWLRADLVRWAEHLDARPQDRVTVQKTLAHWQQ